jgi:hypothetical protein
MGTIERTIQIVGIGPADDSGPVEVFVRSGQTTVPTGITAPDMATAAKLVAAKLAGTA